MDQVGDERGQPVVVAEADLVGGHRVVLVDDRHDAELEQPVERALGVAVVRAADDVVGGEQHLADGDAVAGERRGVAVHEQALADAGGRLLGGEVARAPGQAERRQPGGDRAGGDQHDLAAARGAARGQRVDEGVDARRRRGRPPRWSATTSRP